MTALYIHIPFCKSKCPYCSFVSFAGMTSDFKRYALAVGSELAGISENHEKTVIYSVFFGGGTPTVLGSNELSELLSCCKDSFYIPDGAEISVEANPGSVDLVYFKKLKQAGFNRISLGIQSFSDIELKTLGRCHDRLEALKAITQAKNAGFKNINVDLMYGIPGQTRDSWQRSLETALSHNPQHLSCYQLSIDDGTEYSRLDKAGQLQLPDEEEIDQMDCLTSRLCGEAGLEQYEISNFARPGMECRHNINYWLNGDYYAVGAGAVSCTAGRRERRAENPRLYCRLIEQKKGTIIASEFLEKEASFRESVVMGLRMVEGISRQALFVRYGLDLEEYYGETLERLLKVHLVVLTSTHLSLSPRGRQVANSVLAELV